jgi:hypothetical protein
MDRIKKLILAVAILGPVVLGMTVPCGAHAAPEDGSTADGGKRVAIVIGIGDYKFAPKLTNPPNDARLIAARLASSGFKLVGGGALVNLDRNDFANALNDFSAMAAGADVALFYYAGHGMQLLDTNWLLPVSANPEKPTDLAYQAIDIGDVLTRLDRSAAKFKLVLLDACRNNPFLGVGMRGSSGAGLMRVDAPDGTLISYATKPGHVAQDGTGQDSPYTAALATIMAQPDVPVLSMFNQLGVAVKRATDGGQEPWFSTSPIEKEFVFTSLPAPSTPAQVPAAITPSLQPNPGPGPAGAKTDGPSQPRQDIPAAEHVDIRVFEWIDQERNIPRDADLFAEPIGGAPRVTSLKAGGHVFVAGLIVGGEWLQVRLLDNVTIGYVMAEQLPELAEDNPSPPDTHQPPAYLVSTRPPPPPVAGRPVVHDSATLLIDDRVVPLSGIQGFGGPMTPGLQQYLAAKGDYVTCKPADPGRYSCTTRDGTDLAMAALLNGAAKAAPGAPEAYVAQQADAQRNGRGIWTPNSAAPAKPEPLPRNAVFAAEAPAPDYVAPVSQGSGPPGIDLPESGYGVAEIDGQTMTVIDGERVVVEHNDATGWSYRDSRGTSHGMPLAASHDLDRFYKARPIPAVTAGLAPRPSMPGSPGMPGMGANVERTHGSIPSEAHEAMTHGLAPRTGPSGVTPVAVHAPQFADNHPRATPAFAAPPPVSAAHGFAQNMAQRTAVASSGGGFAGAGGHAGGGGRAPARATAPVAHSCSKKC